jgi:hypothetical protein
MDEKIRKELSKQELTPLHAKVLDRCMQLVKMSRNKMSDYYSMWDERLRVWEAERSLDKEDKKSKAHGEPVKMVVPLTYAQIMTFVAISMMLLKQRPRLFEKQATGPEDHKLKEPSEKLLERDLRHSKFDITLFQFLLDLARLDIGVIKHSWTAEKVVVTVEEDVESEMISMETGQPVVTETKKGYKEVRSFQGNKIFSVSPYRFFPDVRLPLKRLHEGEFCASEDEWPEVELKWMQNSKEIAGLKHVAKSFPHDSVNSRERSRFEFIDINDTTTMSSMYCITEVQLKIIPSEFELEDGTKLGPEKFPVKYLVWVANDQRVVKFEPLDYPHGEFTYEVGQFTPDDHRFINKSLAAIIDKLQSVVDWFINSRIQSVRRTLDNQLVVDPSGVDISTVVNRSRVIMLKKGVGRSGVDRYIKQLNVQDVTAGHLADASVLQQTMQVVTGINDNALGQFNQGRRSASEARVVAQSAAARLKLIVGLVWEQALAPLGRKLLLNHRAFIDEEEFAKVVGENVMMEQPELFPAFALPIEQLVGSEDLFSFDGTLPSEKGFLAQSLQELLGIVMQDPQVAQMFDINPKGILEEIMTLRGITDLSRFSFMNDPEAQQQIQQQMMLQQMPTQPTQ